MSKDTRTNVAIDGQTYDQHAHIARLLKRPVRDCTAEAIEQWNARNLKRAQKRSQELLGNAA